MTDVIEALASHPACEVVRKAGIDQFLAQHPRRCCSSPATGTEGLDVAVVVRELATTYQGRLGVGLVDRRDETALMTRFGVVVTPAVVYVRDGQPAELVARMRDWPVFAQACERLLAPADAAPGQGLGGSA